LSAPLRVEQDIFLLRACLVYGIGNQNLVFDVLLCNAVISDFAQNPSMSDMGIFRQLCSYFGGLFQGTQPL
jgi:hypothetical protein